MKPYKYRIYGFEGRSGRYLVQETDSASEARDIRDVRQASGFKTAVYDSDRELAPHELDELADVEDRFVRRLS